MKGLVAQEGEGGGEEGGGGGEVVVEDLGGEGGGDLEFAGGLLSFCRFSRFLVCDSRVRRKRGKKQR